MRFDPTGKVSLENVYTQPDPRAYFRTLRELDYCIPQLAKPYFTKLVHEYRDVRRVRTPHILDIGCSYGINAALLTCNTTMDGLYERYCDGDTPGLTGDELLARDREWVAGRERPAAARFTGLDASRPALSYALAAGLLDSAVHADLETYDPTEQQRALLAGTDLVISTGCVGYVTEKTLSRVVEAHGGARKPWMAHFVLRMFPFDAVEESLAAAGYETVHVEGLFKQRRFASAEEQSRVLDTLSSVGVDPSGLEADGWFYARLHVSRPREPERHAVG
ncbi:class I SAM-dependent methyltransferase [Streptomyces sp. bgisy100]|uniref:class I SAM-dependent methyltransferase n=1 Tax=Streptomyces sp. bgisy100 TaxID=3413783 RepID=UPI003D74B26D